MMPTPPSASSHSSTPAVVALSGTIYLMDHICAFLTPQDRTALLKVSELSIPFQLGERFCHLHGTALDYTSIQEKQRKDGDDDDVAFLIWYLEQEAFFSQEEQKEVPSSSPDCLDCRMARFHGEKKCTCCDDYNHFEAFGTCMGDCDVDEACDNCHQGICQCCLCENGATYCSTCFYESNGGYWCEWCSCDICRDCRPRVYCASCGDYCCEDCVESADLFTCCDCNETFHFECQEHHFCDICESFYCGGCREGFRCEHCEKEFCREGHERKEFRCSRCLTSVCSNCNDTIHCQKCCQRFCLDCKLGFTCKKCQGGFCGDCRDHDYCFMCGHEFCLECQDGYRMGDDWSCIDCLRNHSCLLADLVSKKNEAEGNMCANCFLSKDDMADVTLKKCANCKSTKYCSRACQRAHWKEHRDQCRRVSETKMGAK